MKMNLLIFHTSHISYLNHLCYIWIKCFMNATPKTPKMQYYLNEVLCENLESSVDFYKEQKQLDLNTTLIDLIFEAIITITIKRIIYKTQTDQNLEVLTFFLWSNNVVSAFQGAHLPESKTEYKVLHALGLNGQIVVGSKIFLYMLPILIQFNNIQHYFLLSPIIPRIHGKERFTVVEGHATIVGDLNT
ncbi:hypothetical protein ACJX0J_018728 [Zea mays]